MGRILYISFLLVIAVLLASGCSQPSAPAATPVQTPVPVLTTPPLPPVQTSLPEKNVDVSAEQSGNDIIVKYTGGASAADLASINIRIVNANNAVVEETETSPVIGQRYTFPYIGTFDPDLVTVKGTFKDGTEKLLLQKNV
jgi:hypothetical protein